MHIGAAKQSMTSEDLLRKIKQLVLAGRYRVRIHALRHMIEEGFSEKDIIKALLEDSRVIEDYDEEKRCLILGHFLWNEGRKTPLHVVCDYSNQTIIDLVTAYVPQMPWWISATKRGKKK